MNFLLCVMATFKLFTFLSCHSLLSYVSVVLLHWLYDVPTSLVLSYHKFKFYTFQHIFIFIWQLKFRISNTEILVELLVHGKSPRFCLTNTFWCIKCVTYLRAWWYMHLHGRNEFKKCNVVWAGPTSGLGTPFTLLLDECELSVMW